MKKEINNNMQNMANKKVKNRITLNIVLVVRCGVRRRFKIKEQYRKCVEKRMRMRVSMCFKR